MKIGLFTSGYQRNPLEHAFEDAKRFGYDYVELWGGRPHGFAPDLKAGDLDVVKRLIQRYEMPVRGYTPEHNAYPYNFMLGSESMREDCVSYLKTCMDMGKALGAEFTMISPAHGGYYTTHEEMWGRLVRTVQELADYADHLQHTLIVEALTPFETNVIKSPQELSRLMKEVETPYLAAMCDVVPPSVQGESIMPYFSLLGEKMRHLHLVDARPGEDTHYVPGDGILPLKELLAEIKTTGYEGTATIELVTNYIQEPRLHARRAVENLRRLMEE